jgi:hypothetical protein
MAQALDMRHLELAGAAMPIGENLSNSGIPRYSVSTTGVLVYNAGGIGSGNPTTKLTRFDRRGKILGTVGEPEQYNTVALSLLARHWPAKGSRHIAFLALAGVLACGWMEIDPKYADWILQRYQEYSGKQDRLDADNRTFEEVKAERRGSRE